MYTFHYPAPPPKVYTVHDQIQFLENMVRWRKHCDQKIETLKHCIDNPTSKENLFRTMKETRQEYQDALALRARLIRMWNDALAKMQIK